MVSIQISQGDSFEQDKRGRSCKKRVCTDQLMNDHNYPCTGYTITMLPTHHVILISRAEIHRVALDADNPIFTFALQCYFEYP